MSKAAKPAAAEGGDAKPKKKMMFIIIGVLVLLIGGGAAFFMSGGKHGGDEEEDAPQEAHAAHPVFVALEPFTVNLQREEGDQFLQIGITLKVMNPALEEEIKTSLPEIRSKLLLLLSSKRASELSNSEGKQKLQDEIISDVNEILGAGESASEASHGKKKHKKAKEGVEDVLFTSFIIQ